MYFSLSYPTGAWQEPEGWNGVDVLEAAPIEFFTPIFSDGCCGGMYGCDASDNYGCFRGESFGIASYWVSSRLNANKFVNSEG